MSVVNLTRPQATLPPPRTPQPASDIRWILAAIVVAGAVLRLWWALRYPLSFDESFTAMAGRRGLSSISEYVRTFDVHPPLDIFLRWPLAHLGVSDLVLRLPSLLLSVAALALFAWWMCRRGRVGVIATALLAVSPFQIGYGSEARAYALLELVGVAAALLGERWLRSPSNRLGALAAAVLTLALFDHVSGLLLAVGLLVLPGLRRDREAWQWRAWMCGALGIWCLAWGPAFLHQRHSIAVERILPTSVGRFVGAVANTVTFTAGVTLIVALSVVIGAVVLVGRDRILGRVWLCLGALPIVLAGVAGVFTHSFIDRTLTVAAWAPLLAVAFAVDAVMRRSRLACAVAIVACFLVIVPGTAAFLTGTWGEQVSTETVAAVARPGDIVAVVPAWYRDLIDWRIEARGPAGSHRVTVPQLADASGVVVGPRRSGDRVWLLTLADNPDTYGEFSRSAPDRHDGNARVLCLTITETRRTSVR